MNLLHFQKPSRYINSEYNSIHKKAEVSVALAFPDIYDIGMSHLGLKILYKIINNIPFASAERLFSPWTDLEDGIRKNGAMLTSLESGRPLKDFDIVGFSLQYELSYTTVLNMLDLARIPVRSRERMDIKGMPLVIAGGPCTVNPWPMSSFIDAFLIGDGEEAVPDILAVYHAWKSDGVKDKDKLLRALSMIEGVFVPLFGREKSVKRRYISSLEEAPFPVDSVVPFTQITHDRVNIEISRGCTMGCRFCQAGMIYRPVRERSSSKILELAEKSLKSTGHDALSFTSLSSGDYSCLSSLMKECNRKFSSQRISLSLPSLRVASVNSEMLRELKAVRKSGFTMAPEAGTDRLRAVINKDFTEEIYIKALEELFRAGWQTLKLYFMIGLPTETDEDISAITGMVHQAVKMSRRLTGRHAQINVGISPFVPKPHTPFQWYGQNAHEMLGHKNYMLRTSLLKKGVQVKGHNPDMSMLEAAFARGDESLGALIEAAWRLGCRLDAWSETFDYQKWQQAGEMSGINIAGFAEKGYSFDSALPWDNIDTGITKEYLWKEYENAISAKFSSDCRQQCHNCGLKCRPVTVNTEKETDETVLKVEPEDKQSLNQELPIKVRMQFSKTGNARYLSHLEITTALIRAMRRAGFPFRYSEGFHPVPKMSFGPALSVGIAGIKEFLDMELLPPFEVESGLLSLKNKLPEGIDVSAMQIIPKGEKSLNSFVVRYTYQIKSENGLFFDGLPEGENAVINRKDANFSIKDMVEEVKQIDPNTAELIVRDLGDIKVRLDEIMLKIFGIDSDEFEITRMAMFGWDGEWREPLESEIVWTAKY